MEWIGQQIKGKLTITHVPSGVVFNTWEDAEKWEVYYFNKQIRKNLILKGKKSDT